MLKRVCAFLRACIEDAPGTHFQWGDLDLPSQGETPLLEEDVPSWMDFWQSRTFSRLYWSLLGVGFLLAVVAHLVRHSHR